jgi:hypothetical protein
MFWEEIVVIKSLGGHYQSLKKIYIPSMNIPLLSLCKA